MNLGMGEGLNSLYGRQRFKSPNTLNLVGCGGGAWVGIFAAMSGTRRINLFDGDTVEISNLNRLPYSQEALGKKKTTVLREFILNIRPECVVTEYPAITDTMQIPLLNEGIIVLAIDSLNARRTIDKQVGEMLHNLCLHVNFEANKYKVSWGLWEEEKKAIEIDTGYENPNEQYVSTAVMACGLALATIMSNNLESTNLVPICLTQSENGKEEQEELETSQ